MSLPIKHLKKSDRVLAQLILCIGPPVERPPFRKPIYQALMEAVVYQQLAGKAAATILGKFVALYERRFPLPEEVLNTPMERLRSAGLSRAKALSLLDIAQKHVDGLIPSPRVAKKWTEDELIERLTQIRGVGPWTVHMLLMKMGREDVLPTTDYGIRKAYSLLYKKRRLPTPKELIAHGEKWRPYRSVACWYLWRSLD